MYEGFLFKPIHILYFHAIALWFNIISKYTENIDQEFRLNQAATTLRSFMKVWLRKDLSQTESKTHKTPWNQCGLEDREKIHCQGNYQLNKIWAQTKKAVYKNTSDSSPHYPNSHEDERGQESIFRFARICYYTCFYKSSFSSIWYLFLSWSIL